MGYSMDNVDYIKLVCLDCGTTIDARVNGTRLQYHHHEKKIIHKGRPLSCPICESKRMSFVEYLTDKDILAINNESMFSRLSSIAKKPHLEGIRAEKVLDYAVAQER